MKKLKVAIIGQGRSGRNIHGAYFKRPDNDLYDVALVIETSAARRERALKEYTGCEVCADYTALFARKDIDLVVNAAYSHRHYDITRDLLLHGMNVLVEKPFARNYYECTDLMRIAREQGVVLAAFQQSFLAPYYTGTKEFLKTGKIGDIIQVNIRFSGFARRWDWQTLQCKLGGSVYNTGPHPIGLGLDLLDFDENACVACSRLARAFTSGDGEDCAKIILTAPGKAIVDIEINSNDAFGEGYTLKVFGTRGTYQCNMNTYKAKYILPGENPAHAPVKEFLQDQDGLPVYCSENLVVHEEEAAFDGEVFKAGTQYFYQMLHETLAHGAPLAITPEHAAQIIRVIETVHAQNPLPTIY